MKTLTNNSTISEVKARIEIAFAPDISLKSFKIGNKIYWRPDKVKDFSLFNQIINEAGIKDYGRFEESQSRAFEIAASKYELTIEYIGND